MRLGFCTTFLCLAACHAWAQDWQGLYVYFDWTSDYRFYGVSESNREPIEQGGVHVSLPKRFYVGVFTSGVRFEDFRNTSYELDVYGGRHFDVASDDLNVEVLYSAFPNQSGHASYRPQSFVFPTYNFAEASAELSHKIGSVTWAAKAAFSPAYGSHKGVMGDLDGDANYAIRSWLAIDFRLGRQWIAKGFDRTHWEIGATATWRPFEAQSLALDLRYYGTDLGRAQCFGTTWCGPSVGFKATYGIAID